MQAKLKFISKLDMIEYASQISKLTKSNYCNIVCCADQIIPLLLPIARRQILPKYRNECGKRGYDKTHWTVTCCQVGKD